MTTATVITETELDELDHAARLAFTDDESRGYASVCRWGIAPLPGPYHYLVQSAAMSRPEGFRVWPSSDDYAAAGREVRARLATA